MITRILVVVCGMAVLMTTSSSLAENGYVPSQPSIDCSKAVSTLNLICCSGPEAAKVDWDLVSAIWAVHFSLKEDRWAKFDEEQKQWRQSVTRRCNLPRQETQEEQAARAAAQMFGRTFRMNVPIPNSPQVTQAHINCVLNSFRARTAALRSRLTGDALAEARLTPDQHAEIQEALAEKGFLQPDQVGPDTHDGEFGPITRGAIKQFQRSLGASPNGFLSQDQIAAVLERPEDRDARETAERDRQEVRNRAEAERQRQLEVEREDARKRTEAERQRQFEAEREQARNRAEAERQRQFEAERAEADRQRQIEEQRKRLEAERQRKLEEERAEAERQRQIEEERKQAELERQQQLEKEAEEAKKWTEKFETAQVKGTEYAKQIDVKWSVSERRNEMTDDYDYTVRSVQSNGKGVRAEVEGMCDRYGTVMFSATLNDERDTNIPLGFPGANNMSIPGDKRINDEPLFSTRFPTLLFQRS
jgi:hypothetical protein